MDLKEYQSRALGAFGRWLEELERARKQTDAVVDAWPEAAGEIPEAVLDFPRKAWERLAQSGGAAASAGPYVGRKDEAGRSIPHVCLKVPTGGGKTLLAAAALERMRRRTGLVLWITPTREIFRQTREALRTREHPYRLMLEHASAGKVKILEKKPGESRLPQLENLDTANYLCVLLLMLPAANRRKGRELLLLFRDAGLYPSFFPDRDDLLGDGALLERCPDLERHDGDGPIKRSLFNVLKILRPVVILDEAHKAYGKTDASTQEFVGAVNRLDPGMVIELSATPSARVSNLLVDISGVELKDEEMIKHPVQVASITNAAPSASGPGVGWQPALDEAAALLENLDAEARALEADEGRYIRPIAVVRVERTGKDQRLPDYVHAEDAREHLIANLGVPPDAVRIQSSETHELEREDLLSPYSPVRWIITKSALMEGWDCPFAYVLVMLDNTQAAVSVTQLVGRVMRMPNARRIGREALDQCYVFCRNVDVGVAVRQVREGLEREGLTGLGDGVREWRRGAEGAGELQLIERRERFRNEEIFLPKVLHRTEDAKKGESEWEDLSYERHILPEIKWAEIREPDPQSVQPSAIQIHKGVMDLGGLRPEDYTTRDLDLDKTLSVTWFARRLADVVPNPWQAARLTKAMLARLRAAGASDDAIYDARAYHAGILREHVIKAADEKAAVAFERKLRNNEIKFDLRVEAPRYRLYESYELRVPDSFHEFQRKPGQPLQLSLYTPLYEEQFNGLEQRFARYLDEQAALRWWHRVAARQRGGYYLRGWRQQRIYPDFIAMGGNGKGGHVFVFETKGGHLDNQDTEYKGSLFDALQGAFNDWGEMQVRDGPMKGTFKLVFDGKFEEALADLPP